MKLQFKSLRSKIYAFILPMLLLAMALLSGFTYFSSKELMNQEIDTKMQYLLNATIEQMQNKLTAHLKLPETLARTMESTGDQISKDTMYSLIGKYLTTNEETFGIGVWYEPYQYKKYLKLFGSYAYRFNDQILYSEDYNTESYNYPSQLWYKAAEATTDSIVWSDPYYDENSDATILTASAPFYNYDGKFRGAISANINLENLKNTVSAIKPGDAGWAFLVDKRGVYIVDPDKKKMLTANVTTDSNESLAAAGKVMLTNEAGSTSYANKGENYRVFYKDVPETSWKLALVIPEAELLAPLKALLVKSAAIISGALLFVVLVIYLFSRYLTLQIRKVNLLAFNMAQGDFTNAIEVTTRDELGRMSEQLNGTVLHLKQILRSVYETSGQVAGTSVLLTANTEQTSKAAEEIALQIQEVALGSSVQAETTHEMNGKIAGAYQRMDTMAQRITGVTESAQLTLKRAQAGNQEIQEAVLRIQDMYNQTETAVLHIKELHDKSKRINGIVDLVTQLSGRTRILALNAGITASQSGPNGRAFTVLAQEIRNLAENSSQAGTEIQELIAGVQADILNTVSVMEGIKQDVFAGKEKTESAGQAFDSILSAVREITGDTGAVAEAIEDIRLDMADVMDSVGQITRICEGSADRSHSVSAATQEQMASMEEVFSSASILSSLAEELRISVEAFKL
ncbi:methyl-accepting chemotaxis protein [Paenibacillus sp. BR2-3]|uniref:methyl-accepting chemotaxis protein n=1 Tax=Paenibacillus sp. BR2-3 TaxID=3048494 RepID=UPI00397770C4